MTFPELPLEPPEPKLWARCPNCGTPLNWDDSVYTVDTDNSVIGCQYCMTQRLAEEAFDEEGDEK